MSYVIKYMNIFVFGFFFLVKIFIKNKIKIENKTYSDANDVLVELGWYLPLLSSCIIKKDFITDEVLLRYRDTRFLHTGVFFDYIALHDNISVKLLSNVNISPLDIVKKNHLDGWRKTPFKVFGVGWFNFVTSLPNTLLWENKLKCIKKFDEEENFFRPLYFFVFKFSGEYTFADYKESRYILKFVLKHKRIWFDLINKCVIPFPRVYHFVYKRARKLRDNEQVRGKL